MRLWAFGTHNLGHFSKTFKSVLLKGSEQRLEDSSLVLCARPHHHTPQKLNFFFQSFFFISRLEKSNQETHENPELLPSASLFHSNYCHSDLQPPLHHSCHLGGVSREAISVMTQILR